MKTDADLILDRAKDLARRQGGLALSPAERLEDGSIALCAGSCIARSAIEMYGDATSLAAFDQAVVNSDKLALLPAIFRQYGLSEAVARRAIHENDLRVGPERLHWFLSLRAL